MIVGVVNYCLYVLLVLMYKLVAPVMYQDQAVLGAAEIKGKIAESQVWKGLQEPPDAALCINTG